MFNLKLTYSFEYFNSIGDYQKPVNNLKKKYFFSKLKTNVLMMKKVKKQWMFLRDLILNMVTITQIFLKLMFYHLRVCLGNLKSIS